MQVFCFTDEQLRQIYWGLSAAATMKDEDDSERDDLEHLASVFNEAIEKRESCECQGKQFLDLGNCGQWVTGN